MLSLLSGLSYPSVVCQFEAIFKLAPDAMPYGVQELVDVSGSMMKSLGMVADVGRSPPAEPRALPCCAAGSDGL